MRLPWTITNRARIEDLEHRADSSYTDALVASLTAHATGQAQTPYATAALEACAGLVGRAFTSAEVNAPGMVQAALTPSCLGLIGRALMRRGEIVLAIDTEGGLMLHPASSHDIDGGYMPGDWRYRLSMAGPSRITTRRRVPAAGVVHCMYARDPERPWRGYGPLQVALLAGRLSAETVNALADEAGGSVGHLLPIPVDGADPTVAALKRDIKTLRGKTALVEAGDWGNTGNGTKGEGWNTKRLGPEPPAPLIDQAKHASAEVFAACGIAPAVFTDAAQGTAGREAWRQCLHGLIAPLGRIVAAELSEKLERPVSFTWDELRASDIASRARAYASMVSAKMDADRAARLAGLEDE